MNWRIFRPKLKIFETVFLKKKSLLFISSQNFFCTYVKIFIVSEALPLFAYDARIDAKYFILWRLFEFERGRCLREKNASILKNLLRNRGENNSLTTGVQFDDSDVVVVLFSLETPNDFFLDRRRPKKDFFFIIIDGCLPVRIFFLPGLGSSESWREGFSSFTTAICPKTLWPNLDATSASHLSWETKKKRRTDSEFPLRLLRLPRNETARSKFAEARFSPKENYRTE